MKKPLAFAALMASALACTAVVSQDAEQCSTDADCAARGPDFEGTICGADKLCVPPPAPPPECSKNSECAAKGSTFVCSELSHTCLDTTFEGCSVVYGDPTQDGTVLFGLTSQITHNELNYFRQTQYVLAARLAFEEFFDKSGARFPGGRGAALIACNQERPRATAAHLANLGVKAILGPSDEEIQRAMLETVMPVRVPLFTPWMNGNPSAVVPGSEGLVWIPSFLRPDVVGPINALLAEQETRLKEQLSIPSVRVAVVVNQPPVATAFNSFSEYADLMDQRLRFNGKTAIENERDVGCNGCYKRFETRQAKKVDVEARADAIVAYRPHFIIPFADIDWGAQLLPKIEEKYAALPGDVPRPIYIQPQLQIEELGYRSLPVANASVRTRITGTRPVRDNSFELFQNKFREFARPKNNPNKLGPEPNPGAGRAFETSLLLLFATHAALVAGPAATPDAVVAALPKVTDAAAATRVTLNDIPIGVQRLNGNDTIRLVGLFTTFDFDPATHAARTEWTTWCVGDKGQFISSGRVFKGTKFDGDPSFCQ